MKKCWRCAEEVKDEAIGCRHCGADLTKPHGAAPKDAKHTKGAGGAGGLVVLVFVIIAIIGSFTGTDEGSGNESAATSAAESAAQEAEDKRKGFHCLSQWDGSHRELVSSLKESLRDPDSFDHEETRITPVNDKGMHILSMKYRARNGFGGMNLSTLLATVRNSDCSFEIVSTGG